MDSIRLEPSEAALKYLRDEVLIRTHEYVRALILEKDEEHTKEELEAVINEHRKMLTKLKRNSYDPTKYL